MTLLLGTLCGAAPAGAAEPAIVPRPLSVEERPGALTLLDGAQVHAPAGDAGATAAAERLVDLMARTRRFRLQRTSGGAPGSGAISFVRKAEVAGGPEAYDLEIGPNGATVAASGDAGLYYGAETLWQLLTDRTDKVAAITVQDVKIHDQPRFVWRGLLLDSARHFQSPAFVETLIDEMALHKLNVLHWHLADDQGWRIEIKSHPELTAVGAWRTPAGYAAQEIDPKTHRPRLYGGYYTQAEVRAIVAYAAARHIEIVPEIDMPGHATAAVAADPRWASTPNTPKRPPEAWGVFPFLYNPDPHTIAGLQEVLLEVMDLFPGKYIHVGGDEAVKAQWKTSSEAKARMSGLGIADPNGLQSWFIGQMDAFLTAHGRKLIGWDEILEGGLAPGATVMSWRGVEGAEAAAKAGHDTVLSPAPVLYLDNWQKDAANEPPGRGFVVGLKTVYDFEPAPASLAPVEQAHVLGLQANLWTEHVATEANVEHMTFPRAAALAEVGWTAVARRDFDGFARREAAQLNRDHALGFQSAESAYQPDVEAEAAGPGRVRLAISNQIGVGELRYTLDGSEPSAASPAFAAPIEAAMPARVKVQAFDGARPIGRSVERTIDEAALNTRYSQELKLCTAKVALNLGDDAPLKGPRAAFLVDVVNPCWMWPKADLDGVKAISASVGQVPFNFVFADDTTPDFEIGGGGHQPKLRPPATPDGELEVRLDSCDGEPAAVLPLKPAAHNPAVTELPAARLPHVAGRHDLCFSFTGRGADPLWVIDKVRLATTLAPAPKPVAPAHRHPGRRRGHHRGGRR